MRALFCLLSLPFVTRRHKFTMAVIAVVAAALIAPSALAQAVSGQVAQVPGINTVAGDGQGGYSGDGGPATSAELAAAEGVAVDSAGNLYIADAGKAVRMVNASTGIITTVAGDGACGNSGIGGPATSAELYDPGGVAVDSAGDLYIADENNNRIRKVAAATGGYTGTVNFTCAPSSPAFTCSVNPTSLTFTANGPTSQAAQLTIVTSVTTAGLMPQATPFQSPSMPIYSALALWLPGSLLALFGLRRKRHGKYLRRLGMMVLLCVGIASAGSLTGCSSIQKAINCAQGDSSCTNNTTNTPAGSYQVVVTATDGTTKSTTTVNVTVQ